MIEWPNHFIDFKSLKSWSDLALEKAKWQSCLSRYRFPFLFQNGGSRSILTHTFHAFFSIAFLKHLH